MCHKDGHTYSKYKSFNKKLSHFVELRLESTYIFEIDFYEDFGYFCLPCSPLKVKPDENALFQVVIIDVDFSAIMILMGCYVRGWGQWMVSFIPNIFILLGLRRQQ
jgi:hypothetical protein